MFWPDHLLSAHFDTLQAAMSTIYLQSKWLKMFWAEQLFTIEPVGHVFGRLLVHHSTSLARLGTTLIFCLPSNYLDTFWAAYLFTKKEAVILGHVLEEHYQ